MTWKDRCVVALLAIAFAIGAAGILVPAPAVLPAPTPGSKSLQVLYREGVLGHPSSINPLTVRTQVDRDLVALLFRGLVRLGPNDELLPDLAESWTVSADGKTYRFVIRDDAFWHDGARVTSRDVLFTVGLLQDDAYAGPLGASWSGVRVIPETDRVVRFELGIARAGFLQMTTLQLLPEHILLGTPVGDLADAQFSQNPLGDGPFRITELDAFHARLERVRSIDPAQPPFGTPLPTKARPMSPTRYDTLSDIELRFFDNPGAMLGELQDGRLDAVGGLSVANLSVASAVPGVRVLRYPRATLTSVVLNQMPAHKEFRDPSVRAGLLAAIDRDEIVASQLAGLGVRADIPLPPASSAYDPTSVTPVPYSSSAAETSLTKGGWQRSTGGWVAQKGGTPVEIRLIAPDQTTNRTANAAAALVAAGWRAIGIGVDVQELGSAQYLEAIRSRSFDAAIVDVDLGLDPDLSPLLSSADVTTGGSNLAGYQNAALDKLLAAAASRPDSTQRQAALSAVETFLSANTPILPLYFRDYVFVVSKKVENVSPRLVADPSGRYWDVIDWRLASDG